MAAVPQEPALQPDFLGVLGAPQGHELRMEVEWGKQVHVQVSGRLQVGQAVACGGGAAGGGWMPPWQATASLRPVHLCSFPQLLEGEAEVFGTALDLRERVSIGGQKVAVYTWRGCTLQLEGEPDMM